MVCKRGSRCDVRPLKAEKIPNPPNKDGYYCTVEIPFDTILVYRNEPDLKKAETKTTMIVWKVEPKDNARYRFREADGVSFNEKNGHKNNENEDFAKGGHWQGNEKTYQRVSIHKKSILLYFDVFVQLFHEGKEWKDCQPIDPLIVNR